jgi:hypothetical protein
VATRCSRSAKIPVIEQILSAGCAAICNPRASCELSGL